MYIILWPIKCLYFCILKEKNPLNFTEKHSQPKTTVEKKTDGAEKIFFLNAEQYLIAIKQKMHK